MIDSVEEILKKKFLWNKFYNQKQYGSCFTKKKPTNSKFHKEKYHDKLSFKKD